MNALTPKGDKLEQRIDEIRRHLAAQRDLETRSTGPCITCRFSRMGHGIIDTNLYCLNPIISKPSYSVVKGELFTSESSTCSWQRDPSQLCGLTGRLYQSARLPRLKAFWLDLRLWFREVF
jgi:hypothetical protein